MAEYSDYEIDATLEDGTECVIMFNYTPGTQGTGMGYNGASPATPPEIEIIDVLSNEGFSITNNTSKEQDAEIEKLCWKHLESLRDVY